MSFEQNVKSISLVADGDQSSNQNKFMLLGASGFALNTVAGGPCLGVLQDKPTAGKIGGVAYNGVVKIVAGAAVAAGANIQSDNVGRAVTATDYGQGVALEAALAVGDIIAVLLRQGQTWTVPVIETIVATSGAISLLNNIVYFDSTAGVSTASLADGAAGQRMTLKMLVDGGDQVVTPANFLDGTTITFDDAGDSCELLFDGTNWGVIGTPTATVA